MGLQKIRYRFLSHVCLGKKKEHYKNKYKKIKNSSIDTASPAIQVIYASPAVSQRLSIAILLAGGIGDHLIALAWIKELHRNLRKKLYIDLYCRAEFKELILLNSYINNVFEDCLFNQAKGYDLKLTISHFITSSEYNMARIGAYSPELVEIVEKIEKFSAKHHKYISSQPHHDGAWAAYCTVMGLNRWDELGASGAIKFDRAARGCVHLDTESLDILKRHDLDNTPYITIHYGGDIRVKNSRFSVKNWPLEYWETFCRLFKRKHPDIAIVQLGPEHAPSIQNADKVFKGQTSLRELCIVLKHALLHVDGEFGLVHLRQQLGLGKSLVLFGPTPAKYFAYHENINMLSKQCGGCMWLAPDISGFTSCARGLSRAECMYSITPDDVMAEAEKFFSARKRYRYFISESALYSSKGAASYQKILTDICACCSLPVKPISEHITEGPGHTYIHASKQWEYPFAVEAINAMQTSALRIADIGGGRGALSSYLSAQGHKVTVFDINYLWDSGHNMDMENEFIHFARERGFEADFGSVFNIPAADESFDVVTCISVVEHIPFKEYALKEMLRVLKPGGKLILTYDLILGGNLKRDSLRIEVFTPASIAEVLKRLDIECGRIHYEEDVIRSLADMVSDQVNIAPDMTVGAFVISKQRQD